MPIIRIPAFLLSYTAGQAEIAVQGETVGDALHSLIELFPVLQPHLYNNNGVLRPFVNLFVGSDHIKDLQGLDTPLKGDEKILIMPSISGGAAMSSYFER